MRMRPSVRSTSQPEVLQNRIAGAGIRHGETVRANLRDVAVRRTGRMQSTVFFCNMEPIEVRSRSGAGDNQPIPGQAEIRGLRVPLEGFYDLENAIIHTNGRMLVEVDSSTRVKVVDALV